MISFAKALAHRSHAQRVVVPPLTSTRKPLRRVRPLTRRWRFLNLRHKARNLLAIMHRLRPFSHVALTPTPQADRKALLPRIAYSKRETRCLSSQIVLRVIIGRCLGRLIRSAPRWAKARGLHKV